MYANSDKIIDRLITCDAISLFLASLGFKKDIIEASGNMNNKSTLARKLGFYFIRGVVALFDKNDKLCFKTHSLKNEKTFMVKNKCVLSFNEVELKEVILPMIAVRKIDNVDYHLITNEKLKMEPSMCGLKGSKTCVAGVNSIQSDSCRKKMCLDVNSEDSYNTVLKIIREVSR